MLNVKRKAVSGILLTLLLMSFLTPIFNIQLTNPAIATSGGLVESPWPMFGHDAQHTARSQYVGPHTSDVAWSSQFEYKIRSLIIDKNDRLYALAYAPSGTGDFKIRLYAINADGTLEWSFVGLTDMSSTPCLSAAVGLDGNVYVPDNSGKVYAIDPEGSVEWTYQQYLSGRPSSVTVAADGTLYFVARGTDSKIRLFALNPDGSLKWSYECLYRSWNFDYPPAICQDGTVYVTMSSDINNKGHMYAVAPDGTLKWEYITPTYLGFRTPPSIGLDGTIYVGTHGRYPINGMVYAINPDGTIKWRSSNLSRYINHPLGIGPDGTIYVRGSRGKLIALDPNDGNIKWIDPDGYETGIVIGADGILYVSSQNMRGVRAVYPNGSTVWSSVPEWSLLGYPLAIGSDGTLYATIADKLYAFSSARAPPTCSIKLRKEDVEISEIDVGEFLDIYVGDSTDDTGIKQIRFSSDDVQDGIPTGQWTGWYEWDTSSEDWNAEPKIKRWAFATPGYKEVWAEIKDDTDQIAQGFANILANLLGSGVVVINCPLVITPIKNLYYVGDSLKADFTLKNIGDLPITLDVLTAGGRLDGGIPAEGSTDFTHQSVTLQPSESYQYEGSLTLTQSGNYRFFVAYYIENPTAEEKSLLDENNWNTCVQLGEGLTNANRVKNIIALEHPDTVSDLRDRINRELLREVTFPPYLLDTDSFTSAVATLWMDFTSWSTRTYLNNLYDEFYKTGIDYECLRVNALINARKSLDRDDVPSAEKYLEQSYTYNKLSYMSFTAAFEVYDAALDAGEILAEGIKNGCEASRRIVTLALKITNPVAAKAADYVFVAVDYAVDYRLFGEDEAIKNAIVKIAVMVTFDEIKYEDLGARTISEFTRDRIGEVTFPILQNVFKSEVHFEYLASKIYTRIIEEIGVEIEKSVARDIAKRIWNMLEERVDLERAEVKSPVALLVYDSQGRITGLLNRETRHEISRSIYYNGTVTIFFPSDIYHYEVVGTDDGTYGLEITSVRAGDMTAFTATDIPTSVNALHQYTFDWDALSQSEDGVTLQIDSDSNGFFEGFVSSDNELTYDEFMQQTPTTIDFDPDTLNLMSKGKWVTAYIELPEGYDVNQIDISSILLNDTVPAIVKPTEIGDYDDDGIADLMVKFDRQILIDYLKGLRGEDDGMVKLTVTGEARGTRFEGFDTIQVISKGKS